MRARVSCPRFPTRQYLFSARVFGAVGTVFHYRPVRFSASSLVKLLASCFRPFLARRLLQALRYDMACKGNVFPGAFGDAGTSEF